MKRPEITTIDPEVLAYIEYLEGCLNGSDNLTAALARANQTLADEINAICDGDPKYKFKIIKQDPKDKTLPNILSIFNIFGTKISEVTKQFKKEQPEQDLQKRKLPPGGNIYEDTLGRIKNGNAKVRNI